MKITDVDSSIRFTMTFSRRDVARLVAITQAVEDVIDSAADGVAKGGAIIDLEELEIAGEGLELLYEMVKALEELR